jgi:hypothetical protein
MVAISIAKKLNKKNDTPSGDDTTKENPNILN